MLDFVSTVSGGLHLRAEQEFAFFNLGRPTPSRFSRVLIFDQNCWKCFFAPRHNGWGGHQVFFPPRAVWESLPVLQTLWWHSGCGVHPQHHPGEGGATPPTFPCFWGRRFLDLSFSFTVLWWVSGINLPPWGGGATTSHHQNFLPAALACRSAHSNSSTGTTENRTEINLSSWQMSCISVDSLACRKSHWGWWCGGDSRRFEGEHQRHQPLPAMYVAWYRSRK